MSNEDDPDAPSVQIEREKRKHIKNKSHAESNEGARASRIRRKQILEELDDEEWQEDIS
jgi:hypothetical protein